MALKVKLSTIVIASLLAAVFTLLQLPLYAQEDTDTINWIIQQAEKKDYQPISLTLPIPKQPVPNAYKTFLKAGASLQDGQRIDNDFSSKTALLPGETQALVKENAQALALFHQGLSQPYLHPPIRSLNDSTVYRTQWRSCVRLLILDATRKAAAGDWMGAAQNALDVMRFGTIIPRGANTLMGIMGIGFQQLGQNALRPCLAHLSALQTRQVLRQLEGIASQQIALTDQLQEELYFGYAVAKETLKGKYLEDTIGVKVQSPTVKQNINSVIIDLYIQCMRQMIANVRLPYTEHPPEAPCKGPLAAALAPNERQMMIIFLHNQVQHELLNLSCALRAYQAEHSHYPSALTELLPNYLTKIPVDPFAGRGSYLYRTQGTNYLLYSVGPDSHDDGGKPLVNPAGEREKPGMLNVESTGDIVVTAPLALP